MPGFVSFNNINCLYCWNCDKFLILPILLCSTEYSVILSNRIPVLLIVLTSTNYLIPSALLPSWNSNYSIFLSLKCACDLCSICFHVLAMGKLHIELFKQTIGNTQIDNKFISNSYLQKNKATTYTSYNLYML